MADTVRGYNSDAKCSDCNKKGISFTHWGPLVPPGETGRFCDQCWKARMDDSNSKRPVRPLGQKALHKAKKIPNRAIIVVTKKSVYKFGKADEKGKRTISRDENPLDFTQCKIVFLATGKDMELKCLDGPHLKWHTSFVRSIK